MTSSAPATVREMIAALNERVNALEKDVQASPSVPPSDCSSSDLDAFRQEMQGIISNALNEMRARHEREMAGLAMLRAGGTP